MLPKQFLYYFLAYTLYFILCYFEFRIQIAYVETFNKLGCSTMKDTLHLQQLFLLILRIWKQCWQKHLYVCFFLEMVCETVLNLGDDPPGVRFWSGMLKCTCRKVCIFMRYINIEIIGCKAKAEDVHFVVWMWSHINQVLCAKPACNVILRKVVTCFQKFHEEKILIKW